MRVPVLRTLIEPKIPGDKSVSHRSLFMTSLIEGKTLIEGLSPCADVLTTKACLEKMGVRFQQKENSIFVESLGTFEKPTDVLDAENSGTTARHLLSLLAVQNFSSELTGDESLKRRTMKRIADPMRQSGACIELSESEYLPAKIEGRKITNINHSLTVASGQVKSSLLLAGVAAGVEVKLTGELSGRDHTERMIPYFGGEILVKGDEICLPRQPKWKPRNITVPVDPSAASFWVAFALLRQEPLSIENVLFNKTRLGFLEILKQAGADIEVIKVKSEPEDICHISVRPGKRLKAFEVAKNQVPSLIDEVPLLVLLATQADGTSRIQGAEELKHKETDRLSSTASLLKDLGLHVMLKQDGFEIEGLQKIRGGNVSSKGDHRLAMMATIAGQLASQPVEIDDISCIAVSDPYFLNTYYGGATQ